MSSDDTTAAKLDVIAKSRTAATVKTVEKPFNNNFLNGEPEQLLGSTFLPNDATENGHGLRASARVIHKIRMDSLRNPSPPPAPAQKDEPKKSDKNPRTPSQTKTSNRVAWINAEKNMFFEALNEYGRDFEAIATYINNKQKRRNLTDILYKTKDQVRVLYYQFYQKASKYVKFSDEVKKNAQELYALINYGEIRKKVVFLQSDKVFFKLHDLVYKGTVTLRIKGKNIKIKTPSCRALRKLNQLEEWQEEIKLPQRIDVFLKPANVDSWGRVQALAQNPRIKTQVPLQRRVSTLLNSLQHRWRSQEIRLQEKIMAMVPPPVSKKKVPALPVEKITDALICFAPPPDIPIHRPVVHLSEFLSSDSICLNAYEQRVGVKVRGATLVALAKRQRHDSEKKAAHDKSPDQKKAKLEAPPVEEKEEPKVADSNLLLSPNSSSRDSVDVRTHNFEILDFKEADLFSDIDVDFLPVREILSSDEVKEDKEECDKKATFEMAKIRKKAKKKEVKPAQFKPLISDHVLREIREGWTMNNASDMTFGDLYVMFGAEAKLYLEYSWVQPAPKTETEENVEKIAKVESVKNVKIATHEIVSDKLKQLLSLAQLGEKLKQLKRKPTCSCGHICKKPTVDAVLSPVQNSDMFKHPALATHRRSLTYGPKFGRPRSRPLFPTKQIIVQRFLPVQPGMNQTYGVLSNDGGPIRTTAQAPRRPETPECRITIQSADGEISQILTAKMNQIAEERGGRSNNGNGIETHSSDSFGSFMDLSLPGVISRDDDSFVYPNTPLMSPMGIIRESPVGDVFSEDVSLSSILGHLENACSSPEPEQQRTTLQDDDDFNCNFGSED